jgi:ribonuclease HI
MEHGKYIRIQIPPPRNQNLDTELAIGLARDLVEQDITSLPTCNPALSLFQRQSATDSVLPQVHFKTDPHSNPELPEFELESQRPQRTQRQGAHERAIFPYDQRRQLTAALRDADLIECEEEGRIMYLTTWYLHQDTHARCYEGKSVRLIEDDEEHWIDEIIEPWEHIIVAGEPLFVRVVQPTPPCGDFECVQAHIILEQGLRPQFVSILFSVQDQERDQRYWSHRACIATALQSSPSLIQLAELQVRCQHMRCSVHVRNLPFAFVDLEHLDPGTNVVLRLTSLTIPPAWLQHVEEVDHVELMQSSGRAAPSAQPFRFNPNAVEFIPQAQVLLRQQPEFIQDLHALWDGVACAWEEESRAGRISSWFVDQSRGPEVCNEPRVVVLFDDATRWLDDIRNAWRDLLDPAAELEFVIVTPQPPRLEPNIISHVIVVQAPKPDAVTALITIFDRRHPRTRNRFTRMAVTMHEHIEHQHIVAACGYIPWSSIPHMPFICQIWYEATPLLPGRRHPGRDGDSFSLYVTPVANQGAGHGGVQLLQTRVLLQNQREERQTTDAVAQAQWPSHDQRIHFQPMIRTFEWIDSHFFLPCFDLPGVVYPHVASLWTQTWWDMTVPGTLIRVYFDGSYAQTAENGDCPAGTAIAAFIHTKKGWMFLGALSSALPNHPSSYLAELAGAVVAHKFVFDLLKIHKAAHGYVPEVQLCYDALTIGHQASGDWASVSHPTLGRCLRSFVLLIEQCFAVKLHYQHVRGHTGEPGNELVDHLANEARRSGGLTPFVDWLVDVTAKDFVRNLSWTWILFDSAFDKQWRGVDLCLPGPASCPTPAVMPMTSPTQADQVLETAVLRFRVSSCNVLTLKGSRETATAMAGMARQKAILQQLKEEKVHIFALQETRLRKLHQSADEDFFLLKAAADEGGHGGVLVGITRHLPYGWMKTAGSQHHVPLYFRDDFLKIVAFDQRFLIVRIAAPHLRCLIVAAHAPHSGQDLASIERWWQDLTDAVPVALRQWPIVLLCDANAVVGSHTSQHIGDHHAAKEDAKSEPFESYLSRSDLWLPSTFEHCHEGLGSTWTHSSGSVRRIDYIGLPLAWQHTFCRSWVSDVVDPTILRADHSAVCAEVEFETAKITSGLTSDRAGSRQLDLDPNAIDWSGLCPQVPHDIDVHTQHHLLQHELARHLRLQQTRKTKKPSKTTLSPATWALVCEKRQWRKALAERSQLQKKTILEAYFGAWRYQRIDLNAQFGNLLALQDKLIAQALSHFRNLGRLVTVAMRHDDKAFFNSLLRDGAELLEPAEVKKLWAVIRRSLPKFRNRKIGYSPYKLAHLEEQSAQHFEQLELGIPATTQGLVSKCIKDQTRAAHKDLPLTIQMHSLPTLPEVEDALRATCSDRATGFDVVPSSVFHHHAAFLGRYFYQVVLKMFIWGTEPVQGKGGFLKMIPSALELSRPNTFEAFFSFRLWRREFMPWHAPD